MSRGHGAVQRQIIDALTGHYSGEVVPPLAWFTRDGLAMSNVSRQAFSRAAVRLQSEGLIDRGLWYRFGNMSTNPHYKHARSVIHRDDRFEWNQGPRLTLVVRTAATPELIAEWEELSMRMDVLIKRESPMAMRYVRWFFSSELEGATPHHPPGEYSDIHELPAEGSLEAARAAISARRGDRGTI